MVVNNEGIVAIKVVTICPEKRVDRKLMTITAIHPGEHLAEELEELRMSAAGIRRPFVDFQRRLP